MLEALNDFLSWRGPLGEVLRLEQYHQLVWVEVVHFDLLEVFGVVTNFKHDSELVQGVQVGIFLVLNGLYLHQRSDFFASEIDLLEADVTKDMRVKCLVLR